MNLILMPAHTLSEVSFFVIVSHSHLAVVCQGSHILWYHPGPPISSHRHGARHIGMV